MEFRYAATEKEINDIVYNDNNFRGNGYVYLLALDNNNTKIGKTLSPIQRFHSLVKDYKKANIGVIGMYLSRPIQNFDSVEEILHVCFNNYLIINNINFETYKLNINDLINKFIPAAEVIYKQIYKRDLIINN